MIAVLWMTHRIVWEETDNSRRRYTSLLLSFVFANLFIGAMMQSHIDIFPVNFLFWFSTGALLKITLHTGVHDEIDIPAAVRPEFGVGLILRPPPAVVNSRHIWQRPTRTGHR